MSFSVAAPQNLERGSRYQSIHATAEFWRNCGSSCSIFQETLLQMCCQTAVLNVTRAPEKFLKNSSWAQKQHFTQVCGTQRYEPQTAPSSGWKWRSRLQLTAHQRPSSHFSWRITFQAFLLCVWRGLSLTPVFIPPGSWHTAGGHFEPRWEGSHGGDLVSWPRKEETRDSRNVETVSTFSTFFRSLKHF